MSNYDNHVGPKRAGVLAKQFDEKPLKLAGGRPSKASMQRARRDLNDRQVTFATWLATPEEYRQPRTKAELAKQLGVTVYTLWRWEQNPKIVMAVRWLILNRSGDPGRVGQIIDMLHEMAMDVNQTTRFRLDAAREFLSAVGVKQMWKNPAPELLDVKELSELDLGQLTDEEVWELYNEMSGNNGLPLGEDDDQVEVSE